MMISPEKATSKHLIYQPSWEVDGMPSCCQAMVPLRLRANYTTITERNINRKVLIADKFATNSLHEYDWDHLDNLLKLILYAPAFAVPREVGFVAVLQDCLADCPDGLFICTDNVTRPSHGDVHPGPFSTRAFAHWLKQQGLANVVVSPRTKHSVRGWMWTFNVGKCEKLSKTIGQAFIKEYNSFVKHLPEPSEEYDRW